jgi:hypothetical protein
MKLFANAAISALMVVGALALPTAAVVAHVSIGIGVGGYYGYPFRPGYPGYVDICDPRSRFYDPYRCDYYDYYDGPLFIDGNWLNGGYRSRYYGGQRQFLYHGGWHEGSRFQGSGFHRRHH